MNAQSEMQNGVHPTAIVHPNARLGHGVRVGAYSVIGEHVEIGDNSVIGNHAVITGRTRMGRENRVFQFTSIGEIPQDMKYGGEPTTLEIGDRNTFREFCTVHLGTAQDAGVTRIGSDNWIMAYVHIAHDCVLGDHIVMSNNASLAGHVVVGDWAILGGFTGVHQFCRIGAHSFCGGGSILLQDLPPFVTCQGNPAVPRATNSEGLKRRGFSSEAVAAIKRAYRALYRADLPLEEARTQIAVLAQTAPELNPLVEFLAVPGRGVIR